MKRILPFVFMLTFSIGSLSQTNPDTTNNKNSDDVNMYTIRPNAIYCDDLLMFSYERLLPVDECMALALKADFMIWDPFLPLAEFGLVTGGPKSFFEAGVGTILDIFWDGGFVTFRAGYRYQTPKGFLFKLSAIYSPDSFIFQLMVKTLQFYCSYL